MKILNGQNHPAHGSHCLDVATCNPDKPQGCICTCQGCLDEAVKAQFKASGGLGVVGLDAGPGRVISQAAQKEERASRRLAKQEVIAAARASSRQSPLHPMSGPHTVSAPKAPKKARKVSRKASLADREIELARTVGFATLLRRLQRACFKEGALLQGGFKSELLHWDIKALAGALKRLYDGGDLR